jgi:predicted transcriptional regulator
VLCWSTEHALVKISASDLQEPTRPPEYKYFKQQGIVRLKEGHKWGGWYKPVCCCWK